MRSESEGVSFRQALLWHLLARSGCQRSQHWSLFAPSCMDTTTRSVVTICANPFGFEFAFSCWVCSHLGQHSRRLFNSGRLLCFFLKLCSRHWYVSCKLHRAKRKRNKYSHPFYCASICQLGCLDSQRARGFDFEALGVTAQSSSCQKWARHEIVYMFGRCNSSLIDQGALCVAICHNSVPYHQFFFCVFFFHSWS